MATFPTLSINPKYPLSKTYEDKIIRTPFEAGYEQTRARTTRTRRKFTLNYDLLTSSDATLLDTFFHTTLNGGAGTFTWTNPETSAAHTVRFDGPYTIETQFHNGSDYYHTATINITEV